MRIYEAIYDTFSLRDITFHTHFMQSTAILFLAQVAQLVRLAGQMLYVSMCLRGTNRSRCTQRLVIACCFQPHYLNKSLPCMATSIDPIIVSVTILKHLTCSFNDLENKT